jgi:hypothetical protein
MTSKMLNIVKKAGCAVALACALVVTATAVSYASSPVFKVYVPVADSIQPGDSIETTIAIQNIGDQETSGPVEFSDTLSQGFQALEVEKMEHGFERDFYLEHDFPMTEPIVCQANGQTLSCSVPAPLPPGAQLFAKVTLTALPEASGTLSETVSVSGAGTPSVVTSENPIRVGAPGPFAFTESSALLTNPDGSTAAQAASDPAEFTTNLRFSSFTSRWMEVLGYVAGTGHFKDVTVHLPPGLIGNPAAVPALCTLDHLSTDEPFVNIASCPFDSQVGVVRVRMLSSTFYLALYEMVPPSGSATELGFQLFGTVVLLDAHVRPGDHGIDIVTRDTSTTFSITGAEATVWGVPSDPSHDRYRATCLESVYEGPNGEVCPSSAPRKAFLRLPTSCSGEPLQFGAEANSYEHSDRYVQTSFMAPAMTGCEAVPFAPRISVQPTGTAANSPTGVSVEVSLPQNQNPDGLAEADLKKAVVTLPEGMAINPSAADGLQACDDEHLRLDSNTPADCPDGSKIGTVLLHTQLIAEPIEGSIYVRTQNSSDPLSGEMFRIAIELRDDPRGLDFKLPGRISVNPVTGRLTTTFDDNPQFPFEDISLQFKAGARAPLVTPASCQTQRTEADLYSWAAPDMPVHRASTFALTNGPGGTPCPPPVPFNPAFSAGVGNVQAGSFTPFLTTFSRSDADQSMKSVSVKMPRGLLGSLVGIPLCPEAQANAGACSEASEIGSVTAGAGAGPTPFYVTGGKVYMTGSYEGAPFGLSVVVPAKAGPFDLGTVVVRAKVEVDPHTAQLTVTTDPLPQIVDGVPVNLRLVNVTINRPNFTYNPTNCDPASVTGTMTGGEGAVATLAKPFQVTNCGALVFKPRFTVSTSGKTSRASGASLDARLSYPKTPQGTVANIARVKVSLPKQLPSRLTTLQKACPANTFEANPVFCPSASRIGTATASTPVLPVPLSGPVYFVSHGGEAFPDLVIVLQGYGVTVDLVGTTFISKAGVTSTTFKNVPDVPVGSFELKLPQGPNSALAANGNLCVSKLRMPTLFVAQDGATVERSTPITPTGCTKHKARKAPQGKRHKKK